MTRVLKNFRLRPEVCRLLEEQSKFLNRSQTELVEACILEYCREVYTKEAVSLHSKLKEVEFLGALQKEV